MNFLSLEFLLLFPAVLLLYWKFPQKLRPALLLAASYLFYWYWNRESVCLLFAVTAVSFWAGRRMGMAKKAAVRKAWLFSALAACLGTLFLFKYLGFFAGNLAGLLRITGSAVTPSLPDLILPVGISFYTFQTLSYVIDIYKGKIEPERRLSRYALFVSFFPQLVAGPIERPDMLLPQLSESQVYSPHDLRRGLELMLRGFFKKVVIADYLAVYVNLAYQSPGKANGPAAVLATVLFALQIYCDFSGYSDIAVGAAGMLGIRLTENFKKPYQAESVRDFWRRWHISLTGWFTDYVYKPLGGSRRGVLRQCGNVMIVFLLSGLWHGASWNFVIWGGIHGLCLVGQILAERFLPARIRPGCGKAAAKLPCGVKRLLTFLTVCFTWIFFRAQNLQDAGLLIGRLGVGWTPEGAAGAARLLGFDRNAVLRIALSLAGLKLLQEADGGDCPESLQKLLCLFELTVMIALGWLSLLSANAESDFIYFQF